jgi:hypothetical protein
LKTLKLTLQIYEKILKKKAGTKNVPAQKIYYKNKHVLQIYKKIFRIKTYDTR